MYQIYCYDSNGNTINYFTQWDINQEIYIKIDDKYIEYLENDALVHFCNIKMDSAYVVLSKKISDNTIKVKIPNILLTECYTLFVYVYLTDNKNTESQKTVAFIDIPIKKRAMPSDYMFVENINRMTVEDIKNDVKQSLLLTIQNAETEIENIKSQLTNTNIFISYDGDGWVILNGAFSLTDDNNGNVTFTASNFS